MSTSSNPPTVRQPQSNRAMAEFSRSGIPGQLKVRMDVDGALDTASLLNRAAGGDAHAWGALLAQHQERLQTLLAFRLDPRLRTRVDAADVVQEAFAVATARR